MNLAARIVSSMMVCWKRSWPSQDCPELSRYHSHQAEIVTRARYFTERCTKTTGHDRFQYTMMQLIMLVARFAHHMWVLSPELSRYRANDAKKFTRSQTKTWSFTERCTKTTGHDRFQYTIMQLVMPAAKFVHHVWVLSPELSRYYSRTGKFHPTRR